MIHRNHLLVHIIPFLQDQDQEVEDNSGDITGHAQADRPKSAEVCILKEGATAQVVIV